MDLSKRSLVERLNFLLTNRIPRRVLTLFMGWFSKIENPLVCWLSISVWKLFADDLRLFEAKKQRFRSLHECFVRELKTGARAIDVRSDSLIIDKIIGNLIAIFVFLMGCGFRLEEVGGVGVDLGEIVVGCRV